MTPDCPGAGMAKAKELHEAIMADIDSVHQMLLDMHQMEGWKLLGYSSFDAYLRSILIGVTTCA